MTLQAQLAQEVAEQLAIQLPTARSGQLPPPRNPEAYDEWLKGTLAWQQVGGGGATASQIDRVEAMFTRAIELDDTYGAAYADRARVRIARFASHADGSEANLAGARTDIAQAQNMPAARHTCWSAPPVWRSSSTATSACAGAHRGRRAGRTARFRSAADQGQLPDVRRATGGVAGRAGPGGPARPGQRRHLPLLGPEPRRGAPSRRDAARADDFDSRFPGRLYRGEYLFAFTGSTGRWWDDIARLRGGGEPNGRCRPSSICCATRGGSPYLRARLAAAAPSTSRSTARSVRWSGRA